MFATYSPIFMMFLVAAILAVAMWILASVLGKKNPTPEKMLPFECGSESRAAVT